MRVLGDIDLLDGYKDQLSRALISDVRIRAIDGTVLLCVASDKVAETVIQGFTSRRKLEQLRLKIESEISRPVEINFIQSDEHEDLEKGCLQLLQNKYGDKVKSLYMSFVGRGKVSAWISSDEILSSDYNVVEESFSKILQESSIILDSVK